MSIEILDASGHDLDVQRLAGLASFVMAFLGALTAGPTPTAEDEVR